MVSLLIFSIFSLSFISSVHSEDEELGGSSVSGMSVTCYNEMEICLSSCSLSCYVVDHCNDSNGEMIACAPNVPQIILMTLGIYGLPGMILLTLIFVIVLLSCLCTICFCSPYCCCAIWLKRRRDKQRREQATQSVLPLINKS